jgi:exonuclease III
MTTPKLHIASWDIGNIDRYLAEGTSTPLADILPLLGNPDVVCLQNLGIPHADTAAANRLKTAIPGYRCHAVLNRDMRNAGQRDGRVYGVATWFRDSLYASTLKFAWDLEGRVAVISIPSYNMAIINVCAVQGSFKPYWSHALNRVEGTRHAFKRGFIERVCAEATALGGCGLELVLPGSWDLSREDLDEWPGLRDGKPHASARAQFNDYFIPTLDVVDIFRRLNPQTRQYTHFWRKTSSEQSHAARSDFALISDALVPLAVSATIDQAPSTHQRSYHAPVHLVLSPRHIARVNPSSSPKPAIKLH